VSGLATAFPSKSVVRPKDPVHARLGAQVGALVEQRRPHLGDGLVDEPVTREYAQHVAAFGVGEGVHGRRPRCCRAEHHRPLGPVVTRPGTPEQGAGASDPHLLGELVHGRVDHLLDRGSVSALSESVSKSALTFPMMSNAALLRASSASAFAARAVNAAIWPSRGSCRGREGR